MRVDMGCNADGNKRSPGPCSSSLLCVDPSPGALAQHPTFILGEQSLNQAAKRDYHVLAYRRVFRLVCMIGEGRNRRHAGARALLLILPLPLPLPLSLPLPLPLPLSLIHI